VSVFITVHLVVNVSLHVLRNILDALDDMHRASVNAFVLLDSLVVLALGFVGLRKLPASPPFLFSFFLAHVLEVYIARSASSSASTSSACTEPSSGTSTSSFFCLFDLFLDKSDLLFSFFSEDPFNARDHFYDLDDFSDELLDAA
jgi:hypothetical protein